MCSIWRNSTQKSTLISLNTLFVNLCSTTARQFCHSHLYQVFLMWFKFSPFYKKSLCPIPHLQGKVLWPLPPSTTYKLWHFDWPLSWPLPTLPSHLWTKVAPTVDSEMNKDLKSLSGGERSFSTICFILSLWNAMESPFRCLDEFDVYMVSLKHSLWNPIESPFQCLDKFDVSMVSLEHDLWNPIESPFWCLGEFDVYMVSCDQLLGHGL